MEENRYLITESKLLSMLRAQTLYKYYRAARDHPDEPEYQDFGSWLLKDTEYQPDHELVQIMCETEEEHADPVGCEVYEDIRPADVAQYELSKNFTPYEP